MCRMAAFPPGTSKKEAQFIVEEFFGENDGTGSVHIKDGTFVVHKYALPFEAVMSRKLPLLDHMPCDSWTIVHLRTASVGDVHRENSHPFIKGDWAVTHNGTFHGDDILRAVYKKMGFQFSGTTDSEVLAQTISHIGFKRFAKTIDSGVYFGMHRNGELFVKVSRGGDLEMVTTKHGTIFASELPFKYTKRKSIDEGWARVSKRSRKLAGKLTGGEPTSRYSGYYEYGYGYGPDVKVVKVSRSEATAALKDTVRREDWTEDDYEAQRAKPEEKLVDVRKTPLWRQGAVNPSYREEYYGPYD